MSKVAEGIRLTLTDSSKEAAERTGSPELKER